jgi:CBS domain-containing protein
MTTMRQLLDQKGRKIWSIHPDATVFDAIAKMAEKDIGSLVVMDRDELVGIITERHYSRNVVLKGQNISHNVRAGHHGKTRRRCAARTIS